MLASTASGSAWLVQELSQFFTKNFHYQKFSGVLLRDFSFTGVQCFNHQFKLTINSLSCNWQPLHLLHFALRINTLTATKIHLIVFEATTKPTYTMPAWHFPWWLSHIQLHALQINQLLFEKSATHFSLDDFLANVDLAKQKIQLTSAWKKLQFSSPYTWLSSLQLNGVASISGSLTHYHWSVHNQWQSKQVLIVGEGSEHDLQVTQIQSELFPKTLSFFASYQWFPNSIVTMHTSGIINPNIWSKKYYGQLALDMALYAKDLFQPTAVYSLQLKKMQGSIQYRQINGSGQFVWSKDALSWQNFHIQVAHSLLNINGVLGAISNLIWHIHIDDLAYWLPDSDGAIFSAGQVFGDWSNPQLHAAIDLDQLRLMGFSLQRFHLKAKASEKIANTDCFLQTLLYKNTAILQSVQAHFLFNQTGGKANLMGNISSNWGQILMQFGFPEWGKAIHWGDQSLWGNIQWQLNTLPADLAHSTVQNLQGRLLAKASITGAFNAPKINVAFRLRDASMRIVRLNVLIKNMRIAIDGFVDKTLKILVDMDLTEGHVHMAGEASQLFSDPTFWLKVVGHELLLMDLPVYKIWVSPQLHLTYQKQDLKLTGAISIPKAKIKLMDYGKTVVQVSSDVVYADERQSALNIFTDLSVLLGDAVQFHYGGLTGLLRGHLLLHTSPNTDMTADGKIHLAHGLYAAYGQSLQIKKGLAVFHGDVMNPELTIEATKLIENVATMGAALPGYAVMTNPDGSLIVGVLIAGPVKHYQVTLFSNPAGLSQTDILSYLILGIPAESAGGQGGQILLSAASALMDKNNGELGPIAQLKNQLQETLGISVNVGQIAQYNSDGQSPTQNTGLILTKRLSPKLSIRYSAGLAQNTNQFEVRYQLNKNWLAQTNSSSLGNGGDVFYTINR